MQKHSSVIRVLSMKTYSFKNLRHQARQIQEYHPAEVGIFGVKPAAPQHLGKCAT